MDILSNLNEEQILPVINYDGAVLVTAGAGSGKTRLLTHRIAYLILEKQVPASNILAITFTNKAANEMKQRVDKIVGAFNDVWISTFHSLCVKILRSNIDKIGYSKNFSIYSDAEKKHILKELYKKYNIENESIQKSIEYHIGNAKNNNLNVNNYVNENPFLFCESDFIKVFESYEFELKKNNALDFDDLLVKTLLLLKTDKEVLNYYQTKFKYIHVDEFQDTNKVQYEIVSLLSRKWGNIMVVGDEDQCIYGWRGANIENIINFKKDFPLVKVYKLEQNYRSTKSILNVANKVIKYNKQRLDKTLWTNNEQGTDVVLYNAPTDRMEAEYIVKTIANAVREKGYSYNDFAILLRFNAPSRLIESYLNNAAIPYKVLGGFKFFERSEIKMVLAYLRAIANPCDNESFSRIINFPKRGIGETTLSKIVQLAGDKPIIDVILNIQSFSDFSTSVKLKIEEFANLYNRISSKKNNRIDEFVKFLIDEANLANCYDTNNEDDIVRKANVQEYINSVSEYVTENPNAVLDDYLQSITLLSDIDTVTSDDNNVLISTVHAVKGLEFKVVFIAALEDGIFPMVKTGERPSDIEEERRLMYVAITRAKETLFLTYSTRRMLYNNEKYFDKSRFIDEMELVSENIKNSSNSFIYNKLNINNVAQEHKQQAMKNMPSLWQTKVAQQKKDVSLFVNGTKVLHPSFGVGTVTDDSKLTSRMVTVTFEILGAKTLSLDYAPLQILKNK